MFSLVWFFVCLFFVLVLWFLHSFLAFVVVVCVLLVLLGFLPLLGIIRKIAFYFLFYKSTLSFKHQVCVLPTKKILPDNALG